MAALAVGGEVGVSVFDVVSLGMLGIHTQNLLAEALDLVGGGGDRGGVHGGGVGRHLACESWVDGLRVIVVV